MMYIGWPSGLVLVRREKSKTIKSRESASIFILLLFIYSSTLKTIRDNILRFSLNRAMYLSRQ